MTKLSVNINKVATLRNTRNLEIPDVEGGTQLSAGHTLPLLERALAAFIGAGKEVGILGLTKAGIVEHFGL